MRLVPDRLPATLAVISKDYQHYQNYYLYCNECLEKRLVTGNVVVSNDYYSTENLNIRFTQPKDSVHVALQQINYLLNNYTNSDFTKLNMSSIDNKENRELK